MSLLPRCDHPLQPRPLPDTHSGPALGLGQLSQKRVTSRSDLIGLPTGYVPFEEVLRFCITDLGVEGWHDVLVESYEQFKMEFVA